MGSSARYSTPLSSVASPLKSEDYNSLPPTAWLGSEERTFIKSLLQLWVLSRCSVNVIFFIKPSWRYFSMPDTHYLHRKFQLTLDQLESGGFAPSPIRVALLVTMMFADHLVKGRAKKKSLKSKSTQALSNI